MKKYYLVAEKSKSYNPALQNHFSVRVSDGHVGKIVLMEFEASSYADACKMVSFSVDGIGGSAICGVDAHGEPYATIC